MNLNQYSIAAAQPGLSVDIINNLKIPFPSPTNQNEIVKYIHKEISRIDSIISKSEKEIGLLQEYRTALISEVVTGKIDVREEKILTRQLNRNLSSISNFWMLEVFHYSFWQFLKLPQMGYGLGCQLLFCSRWYCGMNTCF